ncbi:MAG: TonB-dependent receptor plug domain-containing protein [Acidaminococcales bacterium]|nr:TonB-dependent receptor plug domain-containing protein [Acidaminococcales bacterium]
MKISPTGTLNLNLSKNTGGDIGDDWKISGGLNWTWGGTWDAERAERAAGILSAVNAGTTVVVGHPPEVVAEMANPTRPETADQASVSAEMAQNADRTQSEQAKPAGIKSDVPAEAQTDGGYTLPGLTVEADRPAWEKALPPRQVTVIYLEEYAGEQKDLPDLLELVPCLFVQRVSGDGHCTVARVRGSTGAQVNVYVDGVLMNLSGEAAVNLSMIPVDNVERVEVYRSYVPARFSGSPLGGVINIVTKKPGKAGGSISQGMRSCGGYTGNYQLTAPMGSGSILMTYQRDIWRGDFPFTISPENESQSYGDIVKYF